jgi:ribose 5-phosphate isomerase B
MANCKWQIEDAPAPNRRDWGLAETTPAWQGNGRKMHHMKIAIGSDHAGFQYKDKIRAFLEGLGLSVADFGTHSEEPVDYPLFIRPVAEAVARGEFERGIVLGGSGNGEAIVANRIKGIRCTLCWNADSARLGRQHNDGNVLSLGQRMMSLETALQIVQIWLETPFEGGRHQRRIDLIDAPKG